MSALRCIVPLAGPDFVHPERGIRPLMDVDGMPILERAITSRPWWRQGALRGEGLVFVLRDLPEAAAVRSLIADRFAGARTVTLSSLTGGALLSALAGTAFGEPADLPLCVDLVDILYDCAAPILPRLAEPGVGGVLPWFPSGEPRYSYLVIEEGRVVRTAEKRVISSHASAGTYFFRDTATFLEAAAHSLTHREALSHREALFLCPSFNGVVDRGLDVIPIEVQNWRSFS